MMKVLLLAAQMIEDAGLGTQGTDLFIQTMPADVKHGVMLKLPLAPTEVDDGMKDFYDFEFQVIVRDVDPLAGYQKCDAISKVLRLDYYETSDLSIPWMRRTTLPISYPRGDMDDVESSCRICVGYGDLAP
jgi:hypothetical protein